MFRRLTGLLLLFLVSASLAQAQSYTLVDLGPLRPARISGTGAVVGTLFQPTQAALVPDGGAVVPLGYLPYEVDPQCDPCGQFSQGADVAAEMVVGRASTGHANLVSHGFLWTQATGLVDLGTRGDPQLSSAATAVNSVATIAGYASRENDTTGPVIWIERQLSDLPTLGGAAGFPAAMFENGDIVGECQLASGFFHACLWPATGGVLDLDTLGGATSLARGIAGVAIVGEIVLPGLGRRGFVWLPWAGMQVLAPLQGETVCTAAGGDAGTGWIVGMCGHFPSQDSPIFLQQATYWDGGAQPHPLAEVVTLPDGWTLREATSANEGGQITGMAEVAGVQHGFRLDPMVAPPVVETPPPVPDAQQKHHHRVVHARH